MSIVLCQKFHAGDGGLWTDIAIPRIEVPAAPPLHWVGGGSSPHTRLIQTPEEWGSLLLKHTITGKFRCFTSAGTVHVLAITPRTTYDLEITEG